MRHTGTESVASHQVSHKAPLPWFPVCLSTPSLGALGWRDLEQTPPPRLLARADADAEVVRINVRTDAIDVSVYTAVEREIS